MSIKTLRTFEGSPINLISEDVVKYLDSRKLKRGEQARYRLLSGIKNTDPAKNTGEVIYNSVIYFSLRSVIHDPVNGPVEVGAVSSFDPVSKTPVFKVYTITPKRNVGEFILYGDNIEDIEAYDALELSNLNKSNPYRSTAEQPKFERIDDAAESQRRSEDRNYLLDSWNAIKTWNYDEMRIIAAGYNLDISQSIGVLKDKLETIAQKDAKGFYDSIDSDELKVKAIIKMAKDTSVIQFIPHENKWIYVATNEPIVILDRKEGMTENDQFAMFLKNSGNGDKIKATIQKLVAAKRKEDKK